MAGALPRPNCDAYSFTRDLRYGWLAGIAPDNAGDRYQVGVFSDYLNASTGLQSLLAVAPEGLMGNSYVVSSFRDAAEAIYPTVTDRSAVGPRSGYWFTVTDSRGRQSSEPSASWPSETLARGRVGALYEGFFEVGHQYNIVLARSSGLDELLLEVFSPSAGTVQASGAGVIGVQVPGGRLDTLGFSPSQSGWHQVVVSRVAAAGVGDVSYVLAWARDEPLLSSFPGGFPARRALLGPWPNPIREHAILAIDLPAPEHVTLGLFDLSGRLRVSLVDDRLPAGRTELNWKQGTGAAAQLAPGVYWLRWLGRGREFQRRVVLVR